MATYQDAITAMEISGVWISSERTELAGIYTEIGGSFASSAWGYVQQSIEAAASMIGEVSEPQYGKTPSELTDEEIMEIRTEISEELWVQIFEAATYIDSSLSKTIEAVWNVTENQYSFVLVQTDVMYGAFVTYVGGAGMPKIFPSRVSAYYSEVGVAVVLKDSEIPEVSAGGVLYGWYSSNDASGTMLKAGDILPLSDSGARCIGTVYAGIVREEVSVQMRTKQLINGAIQEFLVYPKTQSGGGGGGGVGSGDVVCVEVGEKTDEELGQEIQGVVEAGKVPMLKSAEAFLFPASYYVGDGECYFAFSNLEVTAIPDLGFNVDAAFCNVSLSGGVWTSESDIVNLVTP